MSTSLELEINGSKHRVEAEPDRSLLTVLRDELDLTGSKYGCGEGRCGACTVVIEGRAVRSCTRSVESCAGKHITTIEGLERDGKLHPLQESFLHAGAMQCAYCTSGMIMGAFALLDKNHDPTPEDIARALEGNVCRCGTYGRILVAVRHAAAALKGGDR